MAGMNARSPFLIGGVIVAAIVGLGLFLLARTGSGEPPAAAPVPSPSVTPSPTAGTPTAAPDPESVAADQGSTVLKIKVADCEACQVTAVPTSTAGGAKDWSATVEQGMAQIELPTPQTLGLAFFVQGEKDGTDTPARTLVTLQPDQVPPGDPVVAERVAAAKTAGYCWSGTTLDVATLAFAAQESGSRVQRAWADPALPTLAAQVDLGKGSDKPVTLACAEE